MIGTRDRDSGPVSAERPRLTGRLLHGHFADFVRDRHAFMLNAHDHAARLGDVVRLRIGFRPLYLFNSPAAIESVLMEHSAELHRRVPVRIGQRFLGNSLLLSQGATWRHHRSVLQPAFRQRRVDDYAPSFVACADSMMSRWRHGEVRDFHLEMSIVTFVAAGRAFCSVDLQEHADAMIGSTKVGAENFVELMQRSLIPAFAPTRGNLRARNARRRIDALLYELIADRRRNGGPEDALSLLIAAAGTDGSPLPDKSIRDELFVLLFGGHETTAVALGWFWHVLATHPDVQEEVAAEVDSILGGATPTADDPQRLPLTRRALLETMRLYPPFWGTWREAAAGCEIGGVAIERGTRVMVSQWLAHHDARHYDQPHAFCPERWSDTGKATPRGPNYFPFGLGPRSCIASGFAMTEMTLVAAAVLQRFRVRPWPGHAARMHPSFTLRPKHGIPLVIEERAMSAEQRATGNEQ